MAVFFFDEGSQLIEEAVEFLNFFWGFTASLLKLKEAWTVLLQSFKSTIK